MEDDVDIYADLPSFNADPEKNDQNCNCEGLKKEISSLVSKLENIQRIKMNLENNLSSLLKTAKAEIARKDKMIDDLRKRLDDAAFRRNNRNESLGFPIHRLSHQHTVPRKYENVPSAHSQESEIESYQTRFYHDEYKSKKPQREDDVNRIPTVFGERLHKRIMEDEKEERKQKASLKLGAEVKTKDIPKENIMENDKENGSQFSINNNGNESNTRQQSSSEPSYRKNSVKRTNEEDDTRRNKRLKIESNEDKSTTEENDYNCITRYNPTDNPAQYEIKASLAKFEDRLDAGHSLRKEETPLRSKRRAASEHQDTKQRQSCTNGRKSEVKNLAKDYDSSSIRDGHADSLRNSRIASTSNHVSERLDSGYKNGYRYSPPRRNYSRSRSDYESSSSHRLRERSNRTYREKKYDDHKYESRYKTDRLKRNYDSEENDNKTRYRCGERGDLRDKSRYSSSDAEDRESSSSYKNKRYENRRIKKANVLNDRKSHKSNKAATEIDFRESSSRTIVNTAMNYNADKNSEQHKIKNESEIKSTNSIESTSTHIVTQNLNTLEEGEILDSPEKKTNFVKISKNKTKNLHKNNKNNVKIEDKHKKEGKNVKENNKKIEDVLVTASIDDKLMPLQNDANSTKQLESTDISTKKSEIVSQLLQENSKDYEEKIPLNSSKSDMAVDEMYNCIKDADTCESNINEDLIDSATHNIRTIKQLRDSDVDVHDKNDADKESKNPVIETIIKIKETADSNVESVIKIKETIDSNVESVTKIKELDDPNIENVKKEEMDNPDIESVEIAEVNSYSNSSHKIDSEELRTSTAKVVTKVEAVLNCDIEDKDKSQIPNGSKTFHQMLNKNNIETCLNDHNYVQNPPVNISDFDATQKPSSSAECSEAILETVTPKETKVEETMNVQSVGVKKTGSIVKNKKDQQSKGILISHRRRAVILSDSNASMTMLMNTNVVKTSPIINNCNDNDSILKPRACKTLRVSAKAICK